MGLLGMRYFAQYDKLSAVEHPTRCHAERSEAESKHLYMLASHVELLFLVSFLNDNVLVSRHV